MGEAYLVGLCSTHRTVTLSSTQACSCLQSNAHFKGISSERVACGFGGLAAQLTLLQSDVKTVSRVKNFDEIWLKICKIKDPRKFSAIRYYLIQQHIKCNYVTGSKGQYLREFPINCFACSNKKEIFYQQFKASVFLLGLRVV